MVLVLSLLIFLKSENGHLLVLSSLFSVAAKKVVVQERGNTYLMNKGSSANDIHGMSVIS